MLPDSLIQSPKRIYLLSSDEPLLLRDWQDQARRRLVEQGFEEIQSHQVEPGFDWESVIEDGQNLSLFSSRKAVFIRFPSSRPGQPGARFINQLCDNETQDIMYVLVMPKLDKTVKNSAWIKKIRQVGEVIEINPVYSNQLSAWISERAAGKGIVIDHQAAMYLADLTEGNLLATDQELEKLALTFEPGSPIALDQVTDSIARSSRYTQYLLVDSCLAGQGKRALKVLQGLRQEGLQPVQILFPLQQALENLLELKQEQQNNSLTRDSWQRLRIWSTKQKFYSATLQRLSLPRIERLLSACATLDRINKGQQATSYDGADWLTLQQLVNTFSGLEKREYQTT